VRSKSRMKMMSTLMRMHLGDHRIASLLIQKRYCGMRLFRARLTDVAEP